MIRIEPRKPGKRLELDRLRIEIGNFYRDGLGRRIGPMYPLPVYLRYQRLVMGR